MNKLLLIGACGLALGVAGCGSDDESTTSGGDTGAASQPAEAPAGGGGGGKKVEVVMKDVENMPEAVSVAKGGTITWTNEDPFDHTVTKQTGPGKKFDSGNIAGGKTYEQTFTTPGEIDYVCTIHPNQTGKITVE
jgi:plastocyanin